MDIPFPGMGPYLERHRGDVHQAFITHARDAIQAKIPGGLRARMQERVCVEAPEADRPSVFFPDIPLDLKSIFNPCYRNGGHEEIDYRRDPPRHAASPADAAWADALPREQGRR